MLQFGVFHIIHRLLQHHLHIKLPDNLHSLVDKFHVMEKTPHYKKAHLQEIKVSITIVTMPTILFISGFF